MILGARIIQISPDVFALYLAKIYINSITKGDYPDQMKLAKVIALFKKSCLETINQLVYYQCLVTFLKNFCENNSSCSVNATEYYTITNLDSVKFILQLWLWYNSQIISIAFWMTETTSLETLSILPKRLILSTTKFYYINYIDTASLGTQITSLGLI